MTDLVDLEIPPRSDHLALVRLVVTAAAAVHGRLTDRRIDDLRLAVSEACANAVDAVRAADGDGQILVRIELGDSELAVTVTDRPGGFHLAADTHIPAPPAPRRLPPHHGPGHPPHP